MKKAIILAAIISVLVPASAVAQVSCSSDIQTTMCKEVSKFLNPMLDHSLVKYKAIPLELVGAVEYKKRLNDFARDERRGDEVCAHATGGVSAIAACLGRTFSMNSPHSLGNSPSEDITFVRDSPTTTLPDRVLISSEAFEEQTVSVDNNTNTVKFIPNGHFDASRITESGYVIMGYIAGSYAQYFAAHLEQAAKLASEKP